MTAELLWFGGGEGKLVMRSNPLLKCGRIVGPMRENWLAINRTGAGPDVNTKATDLREIRRQQSRA
ncbi:MAG TPA: hypothetical protein VN745_06165 [Verrucomicrobiae bacterium]|nr:hypothetical protein [Verrucomicrobiae bacterium]